MWRSNWSYEKVYTIYHLVPWYRRTHHRYIRMATLTFHEIPSLFDIHYISDIVLSSQLTKVASPTAWKKWKMVLGFSKVLKRSQIQLSRCTSASWKLRKMHFQVSLGKQIIDYETTKHTTIILFWYIFKSYFTLA